MKKAVFLLLKVVGLALLGITLVYVIWEPVFPSGWIIKKMADRIDSQNVPPGEERVVRFDLSGKGGGIYNIVVRREGVEVVEGDTDRVDLVLYMEAEDFNDLMFSLARGKADEFTFRRLIISKVLRFAGDMGVFELIFKKEEAKG